MAVQHPSATAPELIHIRGTHHGKPFVAGVVLGKRAAPIVRYMEGWSLDRIKHHCEKMKWTVENGKS
jgi:hypothetical protein